MINVIRGDWTTRRVTVDGVELHTEPSLELYNHSPDGFNWSYGGSGPAQLALAILLQIFNGDTALVWYQTFKWDIIANLPARSFRLELDLEEWLAKKKRYQRDRERGLRPREERSY
jgi:hypothetical protein